METRIRTTQPSTIDHSATTTTCRQAFVFALRLAIAAASVIMLASCQAPHPDPAVTAGDIGVVLVGHGDLADNRAVLIDLAPAASQPRLASNLKNP